jgi:hypothetical protein
MRKEKAMKKVFAVLLVGLVVALSFGCNGTDGITDPGDGKKGPAPTPTPHSVKRPTPNPCGPKSNPLDCD